MVKIGTGLRNDRILLIVHIVWWIFIDVIITFIYSNLYTLQKAIGDAIITTLIIACVFYFNTYLVNRFLEKRRYFTYAGLLAVIFLSVGWLRILGIHEVFAEAVAEEPIFSPKDRFWAFTFFTTFSALFISVLYQLLYNRYEQERRNSAIIQQHQEAQIQFLKAQINPHFLFNTLNNLYSLTIVKSDDAPEMVLKLANLLRYVIYEGQKEKVSLQKEVEHLQSYIDLVQMGSEQRLNIGLSIKGDIQEKEIEPMILIPLVENCVKHGNIKTDEGAYIRIDMRVGEESLDCEIENSMDASNQQKDKIGGVGLANIQQRLELHYPQAHKLSIETEAHMFRITLSLSFES